MKEDKSYLKDGNEKDNPFSVPENYFGSFPMRFQERLEKEKAAQVKPVERFWMILRPQLALVAAIAGFAIIGYLGFNTFIRQDESLLTEEQILGYLDFYHNDFNLVGVYDELNPEDDIFFDDLHSDDHDAYIDYLYHENIDPELIYSEF